MSLIQGHDTAFFGACFYNHATLFSLKRDFVLKGFWIPSTFSNVFNHLWPSLGLDTPPTSVLVERVRSLCFCFGYIKLSCELFVNGAFSVFFVSSSPFGTIWFHWAGASQNIQTRWQSTRERVVRTFLSTYDLLGSRTRLNFKYTVCTVINKPRRGIDLSFTLESQMRTQCNGSTFLSVSYSSTASGCCLRELADQTSLI
jgi:hypothetical protein